MVTATPSVDFEPFTPTDVDELGQYFCDLKEDYPDSKWLFESFEYSILLDEDEQLTAEVMVSFEGIESVDDIRENPRKLLAPPNPWEAIRLLSINSVPVALVTYDWRPGYLESVLSELPEHEAVGFRVVWLGAPRNWAPPIGLKFHEWQREHEPRKPNTTNRPPANGTIDPSDPLAVERMKIRDLGLMILGDAIDGSVHGYSLTTRKSFRLRNLSQLKFPDLLQIGGPKVRSQVVQNVDGDVPPGMVTVPDVRNAIALLASERRIVPELACGKGFHVGKSGMGIVVDSGGAAVWDYRVKTLTRVSEPFADGRLLDFESPSKAFDFEDLERRLSEMTPERAVEATRKLEDVLDLWRWQRAGGSKLVAGLVLATMIQSAWKWRPQVAVTGESGAGKTTFMDTLGAIFAGIGLRCDKPSEAGLRQAVGNSMLALLIDELEKSRERQKIQEFIRTGSRGSRILRGTQDQRGIAFGLQHICWVASIESGLIRQPDRNRYIKLELLRPDGRKPIPNEGTLEEIGRELFAVAVAFAQEATALSERLKETEIPDVDSRLIESFSVPAAMLSSFGYCDGISAEALLGMMAMTFDGTTDQSESDQLDLLQAILGLKVVVEKEIVTVGEILYSPVRVNGGRDALERDGVKRCGKMLFIAPRLVEARLKGTTWDGQSVREILARLPGATTGDGNRVRCGGVRYYGVMVPWSIVEQFIEDDTDEGGNW